jgi:AMIN domain
VRVASIESAVSGETTIVVEAATPLPRPVIGVLDGPPRIYVDLAGFRPGASTLTSPDDGIVRGVRIALHSADPLLTRVVIDLREPTRHRLDTSTLASGRLTIVVGGSAPAAPVTRAASTRPAVTPSSSARLRTLLTEFDALTPLLKTIDARGDASAVSLQAAALQIDGLTDVLRRVPTTPAARPTRDRLAQAAALAMQAVKARLEFAASGNTALTWNAASAAAGALLLLDSAREDLRMSR